MHTVTPGPTPWWALPAILLVGAVLRGCYLAELADSPELLAPAFDAAFHDHWARALLSGDWSPPRFFADPLIQTTPYFRPPGYPFFLAAVYAITGGSPLGARAVQMGLGLVNAWLGCRLGRTLFGPRVGLLVAAGMSCAWTQLYFEGELLAPVLSTTLLLTAGTLWHRWWHRGGWLLSVGGGWLLGLFGLTQPNALALVPVVWLWAWWVLRKRCLPDRRLATLLGLPLGVVLAIAPATIRNYVVAGDFVLVTSNGGINLYIGNNEAADGCTARIPILGDLAALQGWTCFDEPAIVRGVERLEGRPLKASEVSHFFAGRAVDFVVAHPVAALGLVAKKAALFWGPIEVGNDREIEIVRRASPVLRWLPTFPWWVSLAAIGALMLWRDRRCAPRDHRFDLAVLLVAIGLVYFASYLPFFVAGRYRAPLLPLLLVFAGRGVMGFVVRLQERRFRSAAAWTGLWVVMLVGASVRIGSYRPDQGNWHFQRGDAWRMVGDLDRAVAEFRLALAQPSGIHAVAHNNLGAALLQQGKLPEAIASFRASLDLDPKYVHAHFNLALALAGSGRDELAIAELAEVLRLDPGLTAARVKLAAILLRLGRAAEALDHLELAIRQVPGDPLPRYLRALALLDSGRSGDGRAALEDLLRHAPRFVDAYVTLAQLAVQDGERQRAQRLLEQALAIDPAHAGARDLQARLR